MEKPQRSDALDTLRGIAVLLVLFRHMPLPEVPTTLAALSAASLHPQLPAWLQFPLLTLHTGGWAGVDLFFVLSGFLIGGLLFREWHQHGRIRVGRFLLRRAFKIYPAFYAMLAVFFGYIAWKGAWQGWNWVLYDALFVQNYFPSAFPHTWSLAVEEHFYLALPLLLVIFRGPRENPFRALPWVILAIAGACLWMRIQGAILSPALKREHYVMTHLRCDALFLGVLLAWLYHFRRLAWDRIGKTLGPFLPLIALAGFAPAFIWELEKERALSTWGFTGITIGACALIMWFHQREITFRPVATIGYYSYSIYLWHIILARIVAPMILGPKPDPLHALGIYFGLTIAGGIILAWIIELPALRLRERVT